MKLKTSLVTTTLLLIVAVPLSLPTAQAQVIDKCVGPITAPEDSASFGPEECLEEVINDPLVQDVTDCVNRLLGDQANDAAASLLVLCEGPVCPPPAVNIDDLEVCGIPLCTLGLICPPELCQAPEIGLEPVCLLVQECPPGYIGIRVNGIGHCEPVPNPQLRFCEGENEVGVTVDDQEVCITVEQCPQGAIGIYVNGIGHCQPVPQPCPGDEIGYGPVCVPPPCPEGVSVSPPSACGFTPPPVRDDQDGDGSTDSQEVNAGSHVASANSNPATDDDGDGTLNSAEPNSSTNASRAACTGSYGVVKDRTCNGYETPAGVPTNAVFVAGTDVWAWDGICTPGATGAYAGCTATSNYVVSTSAYWGTFTADGYGWRRVGTVPTVGPQSMPVVVPCSVGFQTDADNDSVPVWRFCNAVVTVYPNGQYNVTEGTTAATVGDPQDDNPDYPVPPIEGEQPVNVPGHEGSLPIPATSTPNIPAQSIPTPPIGTPATCVWTYCHNSTTIVPAQSSPPLPRMCAPGEIICVGPAPSQTITPPVVVPAICGVAPRSCLPPTVLVPSQTVPVPGFGPVPLTPAIVVGLDWSGFEGSIDTDSDGEIIIPPQHFDVGPVPIDLCASSCIIPVPVAAEGTGSLTIVVSVGGETYTETIPINV